MAVYPTSRLAALKSAIADGLVLRAALAGVQIASASLGQDDSATEYIELTGEDSIDQAWGAIGRLSRDETLTLKGAIYVMRAGAGETVIRAVRDRAFVLLAEVELFFVETPTAPSVGGLVKAAMCRPVEGHDLMTSEGRVYLLLFEIHTELTRLQVS